MGDCLARGMAMQSSHLPMVRMLGWWGRWALHCTLQAASGRTLSAGRRMAVAAGRLRYCNAHVAAEGAGSGRVRVTQVQPAVTVGGWQQEVCTCMRDQLRWASKAGGGAIYQTSCLGSDLLHAA